MKTVKASVNCEVCLRDYVAELQSVLVMGSGIKFEVSLRPFTFEAEMRPNQQSGTVMHFVCDGCRHDLQKAMVDTVEGIRARKYFKAV